MTRHNREAVLIVRGFYAEARVAASGPPTWANGRGGRVSFIRWRELDAMTVERAIKVSDPRDASWRTAR